MDNRENAKEHVQTIFNNKKIKITTDDQRNFGAFIGTANFKQNYVKEKINQWIQELRMLTSSSLLVFHHRFQTQTKVFYAHNSNHR